jgi:hypothetical protein
MVQLYYKDLIDLSIVALKKECLALNETDEDINGSDYYALNNRIARCNNRVAILQLNSDCYI